MSVIPLVVNFEKDFVLQLVQVEDDFTMDQVAKTAAHHSINRRVKPQPGRTLRVKAQGDEQPFSREATVASLGIESMATIEIYYE